MSRNSLREGMTVYVMMPYSEADSALFEKQARVVRVERRGDVYEVGIELIS